WVEAVYTALYNEKGELTGFSKIARDVTDIRNARVELENKAKELERSNAELEQFAYVASHDLQEPLRTISSYVQLIAERYKDKIDKDANEFIDFAVDGSNRMRLLINSLLEYSRVNKIKPFEWVEPVEIIEDVLQDMKDQVVESGAIIDYTELPKIYADPVLIGQLFQNLIGNAIKFRDGKNPEIKITGKKENGEVLFSVKDNGIGIKKEYDDKIFVIFQRLNSREKYPGTGIGLSICKKIVERHGGKIWVESEPDKGATFYFTIKTTLL
ncbi:MAG TPA: ATP-binding protein, partial [Bacteroidia bacterium]|nr:ATP-binding protein [Bacteroidia bacterium]